MSSIRRTLAALTVLFGSLLANSCGDDVPWVAPLNPAFVEFTAHKAVTPLRATAEGQSLGYIPSPIPPETHLVRLVAAGSPTDPRYDMRDPNNDGSQADSLLTAVRNQGSCGSCWTFASYGSLESHIKQTLAEVQDLSEDNLKHLHGFDSGPCEGGNIDFSTAYLSRYSGTISEADDPYSESPTSTYCTDCVPVRYVDTVVQLPTRSSVSDNAYIKQAVLRYGGLDTTFYYGDPYYNSSAKTYYYGGPGDSNHAVVIVGWDDNKYVPNAPAGQQYGAFIVRNSWGFSWGESGYFYVSYYDQSIAFSELAHFDETEESAFSFDRVYYYDELGRTGSIGYGNTVAWGANWFLPTRDEDLTAVGFYAADSPTGYEICIYEEFNGSTFSVLRACKTGTVPHAGWYTVQLDQAVEVLEGDGFGVAIKFTNDDDRYPIPVERPLAGYSSAATANPGESFISPNGSSWSDLTSGTCPECNVCIKAFCSDRGDPVIPPPPPGACAPTTEG